MKIDKDFIKGVAYYLGDGRMAAPRSLSTSNQNTETIKFFIKWLIKYFEIKIDKIKIKIKTSEPHPNKVRITNDVSKKLGIKKKYIQSVSIKENSKPHHKLIVDVWANNSEAKRKFNDLVPLVKEKCLKERVLAIEYLKGLMAAEGSPKYNKKSGSRSIHLKMKNEKEIKYLGNLLNNVIGINSSILKVKKEGGMWLITISGFYELNKLNDLDIFEIESKKKRKLLEMINSYKRLQTKKGDVDRFYLERLNYFNGKLKKNLTAPELAKLIKRDRTRTIKVLRALEKKGLLKSTRKKSIGKPFEFKLK